MSTVARYVVARERNVVRVDFRKRPDPPAPKFPGAAALRAMMSERTVACARPAA
jgi:hypothetical protein